MMKHEEENIAKIREWMMEYMEENTAKIKGLRWSLGTSGNDRKEYEKIKERLRNKKKRELRYKRACYYIIILVCVVRWSMVKFRW